MTRKGIKTSAQETVVAAGKSAAEGTKTLAGELAHAAAAAAATAAASATATPGTCARFIGTRQLPHSNGAHRCNSRMGSVAPWRGARSQFGSSMIGLFELLRASSGNRLHISTRPSSVSIGRCLSNSFDIS